MTNGSYEVNGKSNLGYVENESIDMPGAYNLNDRNRNGIGSAEHKGMIWTFTKPKLKQSWYYFFSIGQYLTFGTNYENQLNWCFA